jgi:hypothetical protein
MPALGNPRHERFCQVFVRGETAGNARASYKAAFRKDDRRAASRLRHRDDISRRIAEVQTEAASAAAAGIAQAAAAHGVTVEALIAEANRLMAEGIKHKLIGAAVSALVAKAKLAGLWIERAEQRNPDLALAAAAFVDRPPQENYEQWLRRRKRELEIGVAPTIVSHPSRAS